MKIGKNIIWLLGLAIFLGAMVFLADIMMALFAPVITMFGMLAIVILFVMAFLGAWIMKKGTKV